MGERMVISPDCGASVLRMLKYVVWMGEDTRQTRQPVWFN